MKICHITYDHTINYGSCLQAYALDEIMKRMGYDVALCNCSEFANKVKQARIRNLPGTLLEHFFQGRSFRTFEKTKVCYTHLLHDDNPEDFSRLNTEYDAFVVGSDVVWNTTLNRKANYFYLGFTDKYKFSYAASFGKGELNEADERLARQFLPALDAISVREKSSAENAARFTDKPIEIVQDPVLLLEKKDWLSLARKPQRTKPYIFVYVTYLTDGVLQYVARLQEQTGLEAAWVTVRLKDMFRLKTFRYPSPEEWLGLLEGAEYIVTNSFHATAFSTILHKNFSVFVPGDGRKGIGSRLYDFLEQFGLENRIYSRCPEKPDISMPDFSIADEKLPALKKKSMAFLRKNLEAAKKRAAV